MGRTTALLMFSVLITWSSSVQAHGRLYKPPGRSTAWRYGFNTPQNVNDHQLYCGGFNYQYRVNEGRCGVCGDPWDKPKPRDNEAGGKYGRGVIVETYQQGAEAELGVQLTANHRGFFQFRLCPTNDPHRRATQTCLDQYPLKMADGGGDVFYPGSRRGKIIVKVRLPASLVCSHCVLQWRYQAGNNWGQCGNGTGRTGCGPQEEFRACADVRVLGHDTSTTSTPTSRPPGVDEPATSVLVPVLLAVVGGLLAIILPVSLFCCLRRRRSSAEARSDGGYRSNFVLLPGPLAVDKNLEKPHRDYQLPVTPTLADIQWAPEGVLTGAPPEPPPRLGRKTRPQADDAVSTIIPVTSTHGAQ